ncbi:hypothetical protein [Streptomyces sp. NPDC057702]|uniref:hypothetical protein n=1 Tax=unclassified Streptomyces TaxID=2593676 RepID=UPI0036B969CD
MDLLVVDWDYFFPTPTAGGPLGDHPELYAWPVREDAVHVEAIWLKRLRAFEDAGVTLPRCQRYEGFWNRFTIAPDATVFYVDSNAWASQVFPSDLRWADMGEGPIARAGASSRPGLIMALKPVGPLTPVSLRGDVRATGRS